MHKCSNTINRDIRQLEEDLINILNQSSVNIETKRLICENLMYKLSHEADKFIIAEMEGENAEST